MATALLACLSAPVAISAHNANAASVATLRQQARQILAQIDANGERISALDEQINEAQIKLTGLHNEIARTNKQIASAQKTLGKLHTAVVSRAAALYRGAGGPSFSTQSVDSVQAQGAMQIYNQAAASRDQQRIDKYKNARDERARAKARLNAAESQQRQLLDSLQAQQRQILKLNSRARQLYSQKNVQLRNAVRAEEAARESAARAAAQRARAAAAASNRPVSSGINSDTGNAPTGPVRAPSAGAATAVSVAVAQLGKSYVYGAGGPDHFDCSGLTSYAWRAAGVYMPHSAAAQYYMFPHVPLSQAQPGDLIAFGSPIHHIGMVVGGGTMIEAPHTGAVVRYRSYLSRGDIVGVARP